jgi:transposase InsO family protein
VNIHENARTTPISRALVVQRVLEQEWTAAQAAAAVGVSKRTVCKWLRRFRQEGLEGLRDRSSRARQLPHALPSDWVQIIEWLRGYRQTARVIAVQLGMARSTVSGVLDRLGQGRLSLLEPPRPVRRYERRHAGELLHLDIKKLGRFVRPGHRLTGSRERRSLNAGWDFVHVAIDDHSRLAYVELLNDERGATCASFMQRAIHWFASQGIRIQRLLTDNGTGYRSHRFRFACEHSKVRHLRTRPYTPQTNGKAERFIQTLLREWAYFRCYRNSQQRAACLPRWLRFYNLERPHASLSYLAPISRRPPFCEQRS